MNMDTIVTASDVYEHFNVEDARGLERSLYKYTDCGAWGKVVREAVFERHKGKWTGVYSRCQGEWLLNGVKDESGALSTAVPPEVQDYFWPKDLDYTELQQGLDQVLGTEGMEVEHAENLQWSVKTGERWVFIVGSIVEGTDVEVDPWRVPLPCQGHQLDEAVAGVEAEAQRIWNDTHGCEECGKRNGWPWPGCAVDEDCPECGGDGISI